MGDVIVLITSFAHALLSSLPYDIILDHYSRHLFLFWRAKLRIPCSLCGYMLLLLHMFGEWLCGCGLVPVCRGFALTWFSHGVGGERGGTCFHDVLPVLLCPHFNLQGQILLKPGFCQKQPRTTFSLSAVQRPVLFHWHHAPD